MKRRRGEDGAAFAHGETAPAGQGKAQSPGYHTGRRADQRQHDVWAKCVVSAFQRAKLKIGILTTLEDRANKQNGEALINSRGMSEAKRPGSIPCSSSEVPSGEAVLDADCPHPSRASKDWQSLRVAAYLRSSETLVEAARDGRGRCRSGVHGAEVCCVTARVRVYRDSIHDARCGFEGE